MTENPLHTELHTILGDLITASHRLTRLAAQATGSSESPAVWRTLSVLSSVGPVRVGELARQSRVSQPTMTKLVQNLDEREWIKRIADVDDHRAWLIAITPKGNAALMGWRNELTDALVPAFEDLDAADRAALARTVAIIQDRVAVESDLEASA
ncbi:MarR family winged helix-turn-helix transcriptional regulator [Plantibacter sp. YIM 135347]|uniref:MarR family winged helix-turn-helix transcriptional regulator n=1 Tax=Plantibacter sp. YIM 135347 TaxID=3423919 RepID=UPI003D33055C